MVYKYKLACIEAGLPEDQIKAIEQVFDTQYKRFRYEEVKQEKYGIEFLHLEAMVGPDGKQGSFELTDESVDLEGNYLHQCDMERLQIALQSLPTEDREFLLDCYKCEKTQLVYVSEKYNMTKAAVRWKKERLVKWLKENFFE